MHSVTESDDRFYIDKSTQGDAGDGLFAAADLKEGDTLRIVGVIAKSRECVKFADSHSLVTQKGDCWIPLGFGALVNHACNPANQNVSYAFDDDGTPMFRLTRNVEKGDEILTDYGAGFANILAVYLTLGAEGDLVAWSNECERIADSEDGKALYEKIFQPVFGTP